MCLVVGIFICGPAHMSACLLTSLDDVVEGDRLFLVAGHCDMVVYERESFSMCEFMEKNARKVADAMQVMGKVVVAA
jgi:hypothetical protein